MPPIITRLMANKHTSWAAIVVFTMEALMRIGQAWFPDWFTAHATPIKETIGEIQKLAIGYGLLMGADAAKKPGDKDKGDDDKADADPKDGTPRPPMERKDTLDIKKVGILLFLLCATLTASRLISLQKAFSAVPKPKLSMQLLTTNELENVP